MRLSDRDLAYLIDMASCCRDIVTFTSKVSFEGFQSRSFHTHRHECPKSSLHTDICVDLLRVCYTNGSANQREAHDGRQGQEG